MVEAVDCYHWIYVTSIERNAGSQFLLRKSKINRRGAEGAKKTRVYPLRASRLDVSSPTRLCGEALRFATRTSQSVTGYQRYALLILIATARQ
jgi:hypothetical protein